MKTSFEYKDTIKSATESYGNAFKVEIDIELDMPGTFLSIADYKVIKDSINNIATTLAGKREKARLLWNKKVEAEEKAVNKATGGK